MELLWLLIISLVFYILIPGWGASVVRRRWRSFRKNLLKASTLPIAQYSQMTSVLSITQELRFFGRLEAIEGNDKIWLSDGKLTICAEMAKQEVFILPGPAEDQEEENLPGFSFHQENPQRVPWEALSSLPEGTNFFIAGPMTIDRGRGIFRPGPGDPLFVLIHEGKNEELLELAMATGRQKNEYWNPLTPVSMAVGFVFLLVSAYTLFRAPVLRSDAVLALTLALVPSTFFLPPGILFFFLYTSFWKQSTWHRILRDLSQIPLNYLPSGMDSQKSTFRLPTGESVGLWNTKDLSNVPSLTKRIYRERKGDKEVIIALKDPITELPLETNSEDPMVYLGRFPDHPQSLMSWHKKKARSAEILAFLFLSMGVFSNGVFLFSLLNLWIR